MAEADLASKANVGGRGAAPDTGKGGGGLPEREAAAARASGLLGWLRLEVAAFLELFALCGFAVAQPLLDTTGRSPDFFLFYAASKRDMVLLLAAATLAAPGALWTIGALTGVAGRRARRIAHLVLLGIGFTALAIMLGKRLTPLRDLQLAAAGVVAGGALALLYARLRALAQFLRFAAIGPPLFALLFVFASPAGALLVPRSAASAAFPAARSGQHPPIVMLMLDEFPLISLMGPDGQIDAERYPNFAALSKQWTWYRNATGVSPFTPHAMPAMLTGIYPYKGVAPFYIEYPNNLFTLVDDVYDIRAQETVAQLCPPSECGQDQEPPGGSAHAVLAESTTLLADILSPRELTKDPTASFREGTVALDDRSANARTDRGATFRFSQLAKSQPARFVTFLQGLTPSDRPTLHFLHLLLPHAPYRFLPSGTQYTAPSRITKEKVGEVYLESEWWQRVMRTQYEPQLAYTDRLIGEFLKALRTGGLYDDALVIVTGDHGVNFATGASRRRLVSSITNKQVSGEDLAWVPLFVKEPGQQHGRIDDRNWEQVDLLPTVADYAGFKVPWRVDGIAERKQRRERKEKYFYDWPGVRLTLDPADFAKVLKGWKPLTQPIPGLVGKPVDQLRVTGTGPTAAVKGLAAFNDVKPDSGRLPAFVWGTLPGRTAPGSVVAIAVNGRVGALATTARENAQTVWFAGLIRDETLFTPGANRLELFLVGDGGTSLQRLGLQDFGASG